MKEEYKQIIYRYRFEISLFFIVVLGLLLRLYNLADQSYWLDELFSAKASDPDNTFKQMFTTTVVDVHPPFYQSILWIWYQAFGLSEFTGRLLSALIGTIGIIFVYLLAKELFNKEIGIYSALLAAVNLFLISYSQEVRSYSLLFTLSVASSYYFLLFIKQISVKRFVYYIIPTAMLINTHFFGYLVFFTQAVIYLVWLYLYRNNWKNIVLYGIATVLLLLVSVTPYILDIVNNLKRESFWIKQPGIYYFLDYIRGYFGNKNFKGITYFSWIVLLLGFPYVYYIFNNKNKKYLTSLLAVSLFLLIAYTLPFIKGVFSTPILTSRNTIIAVPALIFIISLSIYLVRDWKYKSLIILILLIESASVLKGYYLNENRKQQWREVASYVVQSDYPSYEVQGNRYQFYLKMIKKDGIIYDVKTLLADYEENKLPNCFWVTDAHGDSYKKKGLEYFKKEFEIIHIFKKANANAILFKRPDYESDCLIHENAK